MYEHYVESLQRAFDRAHEFAHEINHNYVGTEHLLIGLFYAGDKVVDQVFRSFDILEQPVKEKIIRIVGIPDTPTEGLLPLTPRLRKVMEFARRESLSEGCHVIEPRHALVALLKEGEGVATRILLDFDVSLDLLREKIKRIVEDEGLTKSEKLQRQINEKIKDREEINKALVRLRRQRDKALEQERKT